MLDPALGHRQIVAYRRIPECIVSNVLVIIKSKLVGKLTSLPLPLLGGPIVD